MACFTSQWGICGRAGGQWGLLPYGVVVLLRRYAELRKAPGVHWKPYRAFFGIPEYAGCFSPDALLHPGPSCFPCFLPSMLTCAHYRRSSIEAGTASTTMAATSPYAARMVCLCQGPYVRTKIRMAWVTNVTLCGCVRILRRRYGLGLRSCMFLWRRGCDVSH